MITCFEHAAIKGICAAVPSQSVTIEELIATSDKATAFRLKRVAALAGLHKRHVAPSDMFTGDLAVASGREVLERLDWSPESIDALYFVTQTPDFLSPPTGYLIAHRLGLANTCAVFDLTAGCSGMLQGACAASSQLSPQCRRILILSGDAASKVVPSEDIGNSVLMGDAVGALALEYKESKSDGISFSLLSYPDTLFSLVNYDSGYRPVAGKPDGMIMDGNKITEFCLSNVPQCISRHLRMIGQQLNDMEIFFLHQPNKAILDTLLRRLNIPRQKLPMVFAEYANCSSASLALNICHHAGSPDYTGPKKAFFAAFGSGLAVATMQTTLDMSYCFPVVQVNQSVLL